MDRVESRAVRGRIFIFPGMTWDQVARAPGPLPVPLASDQATLCFSARVALWRGLKRIGLGRGDRVLVPAYACGSEIDVLRAYGLELDWYPITPELAPDLARLQRAYNGRAAALFVIHYFGFPQPLAELVEFARRHKLRLIEDTAHGLLSADSSGRALGSCGDLSIFSLYKTLPIADGGALVLNTAVSSADTQRQVTPSLRHSIGQSRLLLQRTIGPRFPQLADLLVMPLRPRTRRAARAAVDSAASRTGTAAEPAFDPICDDWGMSAFSRWLLARVAHGAVALRRRENYQRLSAQLDAGPRFRPLFPSLPVGTCPLMFPVLQSPGTTGLRAWLNAHGVECHGFGFDNPAIPRTGFEWEATLKAQVVCLPVHQDLVSAQVDDLATLLNQWQRQRR